MHSRPILYVCVRPQQDAADGEYASFGAAMGLDTAELHRHDLVRDPLPPDVFDRYAGFVVGGSPFNATDPEPSGAQRQVESGLERIAAASLAGGPAALFTCYGIGVVTRLLGGGVALDYPEGTGSVPVSLTADATRDPVVGGLPARFEVYTAHKESTIALPPDAVLLAENTTCPVQAYRVGDRLYATQFHPELTAEAFTRRMTVYRDAGYFDPADYAAVADRVRAASVSEPARMLRAFAAHARRP